VAEEAPIRARVHVRAGMAKTCMVFGTEELAIAQVRCTALEAGHGAGVTSPHACSRISPLER
jgi:hypothetical protein